MYIVFWKEINDQQTRWKILSAGFCKGMQNHRT